MNLRIAPTTNDERHGRTSRDVPSDYTKAIFKMNHLRYVYSTTKTVIYSMQTQQFIPQTKPDTLFG